MSFRKLRIAWLVGWGIAAVLLIALWVRSYWRMDGLTLAASAKRGLLLSSQFGGLLIQYQDYTGTQTTLANGFRSLPVQHNKGGGAVVSFSRLAIVRRANIVALPYWLLLLIALTSGAAPWFRWRYGLRALLIFTALVALVLGLAVW